MSRVFFVLLLAALPLAANAQVYKCAQPGGGTAYQSTPCPVAGKPAARPTAAQLNAERASAPAPAKPAAPAVDPYSDNHRRRDCTVALKNQNVLKSPGRIYWTDAFGHKVDIADGDRPRLSAEAERQVAKFCD